MSHIWKLTSAFIAVFATAFLCSYFNRIGMQTFYYNLTFPPLVPQGSVFSVMWIVLYALMILSFFVMSAKADDASYSRNSKLFLAQLVLQILWSYTYFYMGLLGLGLIVLVLLDFNVFIMLKSFKKTDRYSAYLQYPYMLWLLFATYLNAGFVYYNGSVVF